MVGAVELGWRNSSHIEPPRPMRRAEQRHWRLLRSMDMDQEDDDDSRAVAGMARRFFRVMLDVPM